MAIRKETVGPNHPTGLKKSAPFTVRFPFMNQNNPYKELFP
jgi:hypothetical protein